MTTTDLPDARIIQDHTADGIQHTNLQLAPDAQPAHIIGRMQKKGYEVCSVDFDHHEILFTREA